MRRYLQLIFCLFLIGAGGCVRLQAAPALSTIPAKEITTEQLIGYVVVSMDGAEIGPLHGIVIGAETGNTEYVIVFLRDIYNFGKGAVHSPQDHYLPIPWTFLTLDAAHQQLVVDADMNFVENAPVLTEPPDTSQAGWDTIFELYWTR